MIYFSVKNDLETNDNYNKSTFQYVELMVVADTSADSSCVHTPQAVSVFLKLTVVILSLTTFITKIGVLTKYCAITA